MAKRGDSSADRVRVHIWIVVVTVTLSSLAGCGPSSELIASERARAHCEANWKATLARGLRLDGEAGAARASAKAANQRAKQALEREATTAEHLRLVSRELAESKAKAAALEVQLKQWSLTTDLKMGDVGYRVSATGILRVTADDERLVAPIDGARRCALDERGGVVWIDTQSGIYGYDLHAGDLHHVADQVGADTRIEYGESREAVYLHDMGSSGPVNLLVHIDGAPRLETHVWCHPSECDGEHNIDAASRRILEQARELRIRSTDWLQRIQRRASSGPTQQMTHELPGRQVGGYWRCDESGGDPCGTAREMPKTGYWYVLVESTQGDYLWEEFAVFDPVSRRYVEPKAPWRSFASRSKKIHLPRGYSYVAPSGDYWVTGDTWIDVRGRQSRAVPGFCGFLRGWTIQGGL